MLPSKYWSELSWRDFAAADMSKVVAVLPVAATEQHGPHLPVGVDTFINQGYLERAVKLTPDDMPVLYLPVQAIGKSNEHIEYPGTLTFSLETITRAWTEIGDSVARTGCRKLIFMNSHGGNVPVIDLVARELRVRHRMLAVHAAWHRLGYPSDLFSAQERAHGIHGGEAETSLMLAFRPNTVRMSEAQNFVSAAIGIEQEFREGKRDRFTHGRRYGGGSEAHKRSSGATGRAGATRRWRTQNLARTRQMAQIASAH